MGRRESQAWMAKEGWGECRQRGVGEKQECLKEGQ